MNTYLFYIRKLISCFAVLIFLTISCGGSDDGSSTPPPPVPFTIEVNSAETFQTIAGFGGASRMWGTEFIEGNMTKLAFGQDDTDMGMSIYRIRLSSNPDDWQYIVDSAKEAQDYGAKILASPWSPPAALKSNGSDIGGYLLPENYEAYKDHINEFIAYMDTNGVDVYAISVQNEPDIQVGYESCDWTATQMTNFIKDYGDQIVGALVTGPESFNFNKTYTSTILNDPDAAANLDFVSGHIYGGGLEPYPLAATKNKDIWMTEYLLNLNTGNAGAPSWTTYSDGEKWEETMTMLTTVHDAMTYNWNAYIWWYIRRYYSFLGDGELGTTNGVIQKRGYAFSHFSKFVRPGFVRVGTATNKPNELKITAYESDDQIVVVILNDSDKAFANINVSAMNISSASAYTTSLTEGRESKPVVIEEGKAVIENIPLSSITSVVLVK